MSMTKTEVSLFSRMKLLDKPSFELEGTELKYSATQKILGITRDEQLTFEQNVQYVIYLFPVMIH